MPSGSLTNLTGQGLDSVGGAARRRSGSAGEMNLVKHPSSSSAYSPSIPHYLKGPQHHRAGQEHERKAPPSSSRQPSREDRLISQSLDDFISNTFEERRPSKTSSLPKNSHLPKGYVDRTSTADDGWGGASSASGRIPQRIRGISSRRCVACKAILS